MRQIRQMLTKLSTPVRLMLTAGLAIAMFFTMVPVTRAYEVSFFEFFGLKGTALAPSAGLHTDPRDNIFLLSNAGFSPFSLAFPSYSTPSVAITENFNLMGSSGTAALPADWRFGSSTAYSSGATNATLAGGTSGTGALASGSTGGYYNLANGVTASSTDRAAGWLSTTGFTSPRQLFVKLTNNTGTTIGSADIAFDIEKYKSGTRAFTINFFTSTDGSTWTGQSGGDQSYAVNGSNNVVNPATTISKALTVNGLSIANGADLYLRWSYTGTGGSSNAQALGIDNFSFTPYQATPGTVAFNAASDSALEGTTKSISVNRVGGTLGAVSVDYATGGGSASGGAACTAGVDYITATGPLNWANGDSASKSFNVQLCSDGVVDTENLQLTLSNPSGTTITGTNPATLDITDNPPGTLQFFAAASNADENLPSAGVPVSRTGGSGAAVSVDYAVTGGTATGGAACTAGVDYITPSGALNWASGDAADQFINVQLCNDLISYEGPETIQFALTNPQGGASLGSQTTTTVTINDLPAAFINSTPISITGGASSPYPSNIVVAGVQGPITDVRVTLFGFGHNYPDDVDILLVGPGGQKFVLMSDIGGSTPVTNRTYVFSNGAGGFMQDASNNSSGTYKPTNYDSSQQNDDYESPAPAPPYFTPGPEGSDTINGVFTGANPNGTWSVYVRDAFAGSDNGVINSGWKLEVTTSAPPMVPGTVEFTAANYPIIEGGLAAIEVSRVNGSVGAASVDYATSSGTAAGGASCTAGVDFINASGTLNWADGEFGPKTFNIQTCADQQFSESTESAVITLSNPSGVAISGTNPASLDIENNAFGGNIFSNHNPITIPDSGPGAPYPSTITVSGATGNISNIRLTLNNLSHTYTGDIMMLLVGPQGQKFVPMGNAGSNSPSTNITLKLWDGATNLMPTAPLANGEYKPTSYFDAGDFTFPAPSGPYSKPAPVGADTFIGTFGGTDPNGVWSLYVSDLADPDHGSIAGGWDLEIATTAPSPGTVEFSSTSYTANEGGPATITATRVGGSLGAISVDYATTGGSATGGAACTAGVDYITTSGTLNWANGDPAAKSFDVELCADGVTDSENVQLTLSNPSGTTITGTNPVSLDIVDNPSGTIQFTAAASSVDENLPAWFIPVSRTGGSGGMVSVDYSVTSGTATGGASCAAGVDYVLPPGTLTWASGDSADKVLNVQICNDLITYEGPETIDFNLSNPQGGATLGSPTASTLTINDSPAVFNSTSAITIPSAGTANPYPAEIPVAGVQGTISDVQVTLSGVTHTNPDDIDILVVSPTGQKFLLMSDAGGSPNITNRSYTFSDSGFGYMSDTGANPSGTYLPTNYDGADDVFPAPAPGDPYATPGPGGSNTLNGTFGGIDPNGTWNVYVRDAQSPSSGSISVITLQILTTAPGPGTLSFSAPSYDVNEGGTASISISRAGGSVGAASVGYATGSGTATGDTACVAGVDFVNASGTLTWADGEAGPKSFNVPSCPDTELSEPGETVTLTLSNPTGSSISGTNPANLTIINDFGGISFSNPAPITIPDSGAASPYPSTITVSGLSGTLSNIRVRLNNISHTYGADTMMLLVGPGGETFVPFSNVGSSAPISNVSVILEDSGIGFIPSGAFTSGTYKPTNYAPDGSYPAPAPGAPYNEAGPDGASTLAGAFGGINPNGNWNLYVFDQAGGDQGLIAGGWGLDIQTTTPTPGTVEFSTATYTGMEGSMATITAKRVAGNLGPISVDYATSNGTAMGDAACGPAVDFVNTSGTLNWADADTANKSFTVQLCSDPLLAESTETITLTLSNPVGTSITGTNPATLNIENNSFAGTSFSNPAAITIPNVGSANPYPSTITVSGMTGAITEVRMVLKNFSHTYTSDVDILLVGPQGQKFVPVSDVGGNTPSNGVTLSLYDSAAANMTAAALANGSYKPTDNPGNPDSWPSPAPSGPYNSAAPWGGSTFANVFNGSDPNGVWSLYVIDQFSPDGGTIADGWDLQIEAAETVRFNPASYTPSENAGTVSLTVVRPSSANAATVDYTLPSAGALYPAVGGASCGAGTDYINTPGTVNFGVGDLTKNIDITLCDDAVFDGLKIILPELSNPTGGLVLGSPSVATVFINDDEPPPTLSISDVTVNEGAGTATFVVTQSFMTNTLTQFLYSTSDGSALAGFDYTGATNATGTIPVGSTTTNIVVPITQDNGFEETETFSVAFTNIINADPADPVGVGTITDDDTAASYVVTSTNNTNDGACNATHCSLREAINASNAAPGIISFASGLTGTITFSGSRPQITNNTVINGPGANVLAVSGNNIVTVFDIPNAGPSVTIRGLTIRNGFNLDFAAGGAITNNGQLVVEDSIITASRGNFAGAIQTFAPMTIRNSTLSNNVGGNDGMQPGCSNIGGAIDSSNDVTINIINSTITGNSVSTNCSANAGAINLFSGRVVITGSTITNNTGSNFSGAIDGGSAQTSIVRNSIIAGNTGDPAKPDVNDTIIESGGFNIIGNPGTITAFNQPTDQTGTTGSPLNPGLGALGNNGGTTPTHAVLAGSPALDKGKSFGLATDQRGSGRPYDDPATANAAGGDGSDIGAYEAVVPVISVTGGPLNFGSVLVGGFSTEQTYTVSGMNLAGDVTVTAPADFQVSTTSGSGFGTSLTLTQSGGTVATTTIYVRFAPASPGAASGNITNESAGAGTQSVGVSGTGALAGTIQFASATPSDNETNSDHSYNVVVTRTGGSYGAVTVDYAVTDGTATTAGNDYSISPATGTLNWADGDTADKNITITITGDMTFEPDETVNLGISNATGGAALGSPSSSVLTITNDDGQPAISVDDVTFTGADSLVGSGFTVTLSNPSTQTVTVHYATANDTAIAGEDYTATSGTLTFNPGETSKDVPVAILPDTVNEATEQFFVNLDTPVNGTIADGQGIGTIPNDDPDVSFSIDDVTHTEGNSGTVSYTFTITKTGTTAQTVFVDYATVNGTAVSSSDFTAVSGNLAFAPADTTKQVIVLVNGDTSFETDETFIVRLSNPVNASLTDGDGLGTITNDDAPQIFLVNVNDDTDDGTCDAANCSLREAINAVNVAGGQIDFAPNVTGSISLLSALPPLASSNATVINGPGAGVLAVKRDSSIGALRIFDIQGSGVFTISGLAINDGEVRPIGGAFNNLGGAIRIMAGHGVTINNCTFTNNWANNGAAIYNGANPATSPLTVNNSTFTANNANQSGGGIENRFSNQLTVNGSTFDANGANNFGGGIHNIASGVVFINDSTFTGNVANTGGAVNNDDTGSLTINRTIISGNHGVVGGGISNKNGGLDVFNSTISGNDASEGGGAYNHVATMNFYNSTISGNTATSIGGGIYYTFQGASHGTIQNCTITNNHGPNGGGVMVFNGQSVVRMGNAILAANTGSQGPDLYGTIYSSGYNILGTTGGTYGDLHATTGDQVGQFSVINPVLGPLQNNGGLTKTHLPLPGSPAIDAGNAFGETADQRGFTRTVNGITDIGAVEVQPAPTQIAVFAGSPQSVTEGTFFSPLQARVLDAGNAPVGGVTVTFTAPPSGASGLFANSTTQTTAITDANGVATSSVLTANNTAGSFNVTAAFAASSTASFNLTITETPRSISVNDVTFTGADSLVPTGFTVSLSAVSSQTIIVHYTTADGTAIAGQDYVGESHTLTFNPGQTSKNVPITILPDTVNEPTEQFFLNLDSPVNAVIADNQGVGTIPNDDPEVSFSIDDINPLEGTGATTSFTFTITKNGSTSQTTSVNWSTADGTAIAPVDYTAVSSTLVTFLPGDTSKQVTVLVNGDENYEMNDTFTVSLSSPVNATILDGSGTAVIVNDDAIPSFTIEDVTHNEGNTGTTSYTFTVTKNGATELDSSVQFETQDGTATLADNDYQSNTGTLNFLATDSSKQVTVLVNGNFFIEPDENFTVHLSNATMGAISDADGTGTIVNDDFTPVVTYVDDDWTAITPGTDPDGAGPANAIGYDAFDKVQEGIDAVAASGQVNVYAGTYDEDVTANNPGVRIIGAGAGSTNIRGVIGGPGSTVQITASNVTVAGFTITRLGNNTTDWNDPGLNNVGIAIQGQTITGATIRDNILTANRTGIDINNSNGHTVRNNVIDFNRIGLIFRHQTDSMTVVENFITNNWTLGVVFLDGSGGTNNPPQQALNSFFNNNNISGNWYGQIVDRQSGGLLPAPGTTNLKNFKGNWFGIASPVFTTANSAEPGYAGQIPVAYGGTATAPGGQPDIAGPASANFQYRPQLLSGVDTNIETTPGRGTFGFQGVANVPILDISDHTFTGADSLVAGGFTVTLTGDTTQIVTVHYHTNDGTALDGQDYTGVSGTLTFDPGETSKEIPVDILPDSVQENTEQFSIDLDTPVNAGILDGNATGTIPNDDAAPSFSIDNVSHSEGNSGIVNYVFTVTKTGGTALPSSIDFATQNDSASTPEGDFQAISGTLNFGPADTTMQITVQVNSDLVFENDEQFEVVLTNPVNATVTNSTGTGAILNDDAPPTIAIDDVTMTEGDSGTKTFTFTITKTGLTAFNGGVDYVVQDGTATPGDADFVSASGNVGFLIADTTKTVSVTINGDAKYETDETFVVHLQNEGGLVVSRRDGTGTITNDDAPPTVSIGDVTFTGADSLAVGGFAVTLTGATEIPVTVHYQTANDTAIAGEDYTATSGTLTFNPGETQVQNIPVSILPDTTQEATEQFFMNLDTPVGAAIADGQGVGTIPNDDAAPSFSIDNVTQGESAGGFTTFVFFVTKTGSTALPSSIDYTTQAGTATAGATCGTGVDYETRSGTLNFAASDTSQMVLVNVCGDTTVEGDETFTVHLSNAVNGSITTADGLGTIQNNTTPAVQFQSATYMEDESQTAVITLIRTGDTAGASTVSFATSNGTAQGGACSTLGIDYQSVSTSVTFDPTETTKTVNVPVCMDTLFETTFETVNLALSSNTTVLGDQSTAVLNVNDTAAQFKSSTPITIGDGGPANPYPATINVTGAPSVTGTMRVTLFDLTHAHPEDLDILLVAPNGQTMVLMADSGGTNALTGNGATLTFDDAAGAVLPDSALITTRKYEPTTWGPVAPFIAPAPGGPYSMPNSTVGGSINLNSVFGAVHPNGIWQLFIRDQNGLPPLGAGQIAAGWGLQFLAPTEANATISGRVTTASGNGIRNAIVKITGGNLAEPRVVATGAFGSYLFENLPVGQTYVVQVSAKRFRFGQPSMVITLQDAASVDFVANPQE